MPIAERLRVLGARVRRSTHSMSSRLFPREGAAGHPPASGRAVDPNGTNPDTDLSGGTSPKGQTDPRPPAQRLAPPIEQAIARVVADHLSYLGAANLRALAAAVVDLEVAAIPGTIVEAGTALGGSAIVMTAAKARGRPMKVFDVFGLIPPPGERDGEDVHQRYETILSGTSPGLGGDSYYGYRGDLLQEVADNFARHGFAVEHNNVELIRGLFQDTVHLDGPVALAHLDGDWYESTLTCLTRLTPLLPSGGRLVIDDYDAWSGCRTAVDEYFATRSGFRFERRARLHIVRD